MAKKDIYKEFGIEYKAGKIVSPIGNINPLLVDGNEKIGKGVWHFSTLAGNKEYNVTVCGEKTTCFGTCAGNCEGGYCMTGNYNFPSVKDALAVRTIIAREYPDFCERAILAQLKADKIETVRIHATGDFFSRDYLDMWRRIVKATPSVTYWTYTKETAAESAFDEFANANIIKSNIDGAGFNYGHCDYIRAIYEMLRDMGKSVYICRCGIDKGQHCAGCKGCSNNEYVLFIEHSTEYVAEKDPAFESLKAIIDAQ
jgi:hypothetical protein